MGGHQFFATLASQTIIHVKHNPYLFYLFLLFLLTEGKGNGFVLHQEVKN